LEQRCYPPTDAFFQPRFVVGRFSTFKPTLDVFWISHKKTLLVRIPCSSYEHEYSSNWRRKKKVRCNWHSMLFYHEQNLRT